ncbi:MAG: 1-deoxy-D-xylulose-5-phosphate synthase [Bacteroidales bacterium]|nr:1-deoxy-D-xylulose-5-phosphate synthase [Bacteroidales bacterium]
MDEKLTAILDQLNYPSDLRELPESKLPEVCEAVRRFIINQVAIHPGHLGSSLGVVELTVALHYVYYTPEDRLVWDVGHQAYAHKVLTGRKEQFSTLRMKDGLRGFPFPEESEYDTFSAGHASNSISAALGMAVANKIDGSDRKVVAIIGDASISGGLAFEGLNNASSQPNDLLIILNDNRMAISENVGALNHYLTKITTSERYNLLRYRAYQTLRRHNMISDRVRRSFLRFANALKSLFSHRQNIFEGLDIRYFGPVDGHDVVKLVHVLRKIKDLKGPKMLHVCTIKGKGFRPAEDEATIWHAPGKFNPETGERILEDTTGMPPQYQDVFGETLVELAEKDQRIMGITPAMPLGCSMNFMMDRFPERSFDVGIAEEHAVTFSGGLAKEGKIPFCNIYSSFMQRAMDQVIHDVALMNLHVVFCLDRAGLVGADGPTHHGAFDLAFFRVIPNMVVCSPINEHWLRRLMCTAAQHEGPMMIRYPRGRGVLVDWQCPLEPVQVGKGYCVRPGKGTTAVLSLGPIGNEVAKALSLVDEDLGVAHYDMVFCKPLDTDLLSDIFANYKRVITVEDGCINGGFGSAVLEEANLQNYQGKIIRLGIPDEFVEQGSCSELYQLCGIDAKSIAESIMSNL